MKAMQSSSWLILSIAVIVAGTQYLARGEQGAVEAPEAIAIIDISVVFTESEQFRQEMEAIKSDVADSEKSLREDRDVIKQLVRDLAVAEDPIVKNRLRAHVDEKNALLQAEVKRKKEEFMQREAETYARNYRVIERHIREYAVQHDIRLVLRYNRIEIPDDNNREKILAVVNRAVVYHGDLDVTDAILKAVNGERRDS